MAEQTPGFEGLGVPGELSVAVVEPTTAIEPGVGLAEDVQHPGATGVRRPQATRIPVPTGTPVVLLVSTGPSDRPAPYVAMPDLRTVGIESATRKAAKLGLVLQASPTYAPGVRQNSVALQYPDPGQRVQSGTTVSVLISNGRKPPKGVVTQLADLVGTLAGDAENSVLAMGLRPVVMRTSHPAVPPEVVFAQLPNAAAQIKRSAGGLMRVVLWAVVAVVATLALATVVSMYVSSAR